METWNERLKTLRNEAKLYQYDLADKIGVSRYLVCRWESGKAHPDPESLLKLCDLFGVSADYLLGRTDWNIDFTKIDPAKRALIEEYIKFINKR